MHIPTEETHNIEILSFDDARKRSNSSAYDQTTWIYVPDFYTEYRYVLGTRGVKPVICAGINPSTAEPGNLDPTLKSVSRISITNGFDSWLMFNVYAQRATRPDDMDLIRNDFLHNENMLAFHAMLELASLSGTVPVIWAAWGTIIEKRSWLMDCVNDMQLIAREFDAKWVCAGKCSRKGHPHHPLYLKKDESFYDFDIEGYIS